MDEQTAIQRLKNGDIGGLEYLVHRFQARAVRTAYLIVQDASLAEDVAQDCFIQAYRGIDSFDPGRPFEPWFLKIIVHAAVKAARKAAKQTGFDPDSDDAAFDALFGWVESAEKTAEFNSFKQEIRDALKRLSPRQRAMVVQRYYLGMSEKEMAEQASIAPGTVKWSLNAARSRLRNFLGERGAE
jgi:RNA polymerase sigma-70 factor, ECF subfamily